MFMNEFLGFWMRFNAHDFGWISRLLDEINAHDLDEFLGCWMRFNAHVYGWISRLLDEDEVEDWMKDVVSLEQLGIY